MRKLIDLKEDELVGKIMIKSVWLRAKTKGTKKFVTKRKLKSENRENCLEATQLENKINHLEKKETDIQSFSCHERKHKEFIKNNKSILKTQQIFRSEKHNVMHMEEAKI